MRAEKERYYLRILLLNVKGARSFEELRTYNGELYDTFEEAAYARGLFINDNEWINVLDEAVSNQSPSNIRQLYVSSIDLTSHSNFITSSLMI